MKRILRHTIAGLLVACLMAANLSPLAFPMEARGRICVKIDAHNGSLPSDGKEEKTESLKFARATICIAHPWVEGRPERFFEHPQCSKRKIYLPIVVPPPEALA